MGITRSHPAPDGAAQPKRDSRSALPGSAARDLAHRLVAGVLIDQRPFEQVLADLADRPKAAALAPRDRAFARALATTVLRRQGELEHVLNAFLERPLPKEAGHVWAILLTGAAQLICLGTPPHAAVDMAVEATRRVRGGARFANLTNAILRRVAKDGAALLQGKDRAALNVPDWLRQRWRSAYGEDLSRRIAEASLKEAALDISLKPGADTGYWAARLRRPRSADRLDPAGRAGPHRGHAGLCRRRMVGAGRRGRARCAGGGRGGGANGRRSLRRAGREDGGPGGSRCHRDRSRRVAEAARPPARESAAARPFGRGGCRRCGELGAGAHLRRGDPRCALHGHGHHPPASRYYAPQAAGGRGPDGRSAAQPCWQTRPAWSGRAASWSTARVRWSRRKANARSRLFSAADRISGVCRSRPASSAPTQPGSPRPVI